MSMIYTVRTGTKYRVEQYGEESDNGLYETKMTVFNDIKALAEEVKDVVFREIHDLYSDKHLVEEWNLSKAGDCYEVEPRYAEACMLYETLTMDKKLKKIIEGYGLSPIELPQFTIDGYWDWYTDCMKDCNEYLDVMRKYRDDLLEHVQNNFPVKSFTIKVPKWNRRTGYEWLNVVELKVINLEKEFFNAPRVTINQTSAERAEEEHWKWYNSKEGKAERKAWKERQDEISMFMGENGYHNYTYDAETGVHRMW